MVLAILTFINLIKNIMERIELGDLVQDAVTKFKGIATQKVYYLQGCARFALNPQGLTKEGKMKDSFFFDEPQLTVVKKAVVKVDPEILKETRTGGFCSQVPTK